MGASARSVSVSVCAYTRSQVRGFDVFTFGRISRCVRVSASYLPLTTCPPHTLTRIESISHAGTRQQHWHLGRRGVRHRVASFNPDAGKAYTDTRPFVLSSQQATAKAREDDGLPFKGKASCVRHVIPTDEQESESHCSRTDNRKVIFTK